MCCSLAHLHLHDSDNSVTLLSSFAPHPGTADSGSFFRIYLYLASLTKTHSFYTLSESSTTFTLGLGTPIFITVFLSFFSVMTLGVVPLTCRPVPLLPVNAECPWPPPNCQSLRVQLRPRPSTSGLSLLFTTIALPFICILHHHGTLSCHESHHYTQLDG